MIEIVFEYKADRYSEPEIGYTYFLPKSQDFKEVVVEANEHFKKFCSGQGWTRKAKLKSIQLCLNENTPPPLVVVKPDPVKPARKRSTSTRRSNPKTSTSKSKNSVRRPRVSDSNKTSKKTRRKL